MNSVLERSETVQILEMQLSTLWREFHLGSMRAAELETAADDPFKSRVEQQTLREAAHRERTFVARVEREIELLQRDLRGDSL